MYEYNVEIEMKVTMKNGKVNGCVLYHESTLANMYAMCHIRRAIFHRQFSLCNGAWVVFFEDKHYPFLGNRYHLQELCEYLNVNDIVLRQLHVLSNGRYITVIGNGLADEECGQVIPRKNNSNKSLDSFSVAQLSQKKKKAMKQRNPMREKCYFA